MQYDTRKHLFAFIYRCPGHSRLSRHSNVMDAGGNYACINYKSFFKEPFPAVPIDTSITCTPFAAIIMLATAIPQALCHAATPRLMDPAKSIKTTRHR